MASLPAPTLTGLQTWNTVDYGSQVYSGPDWGYASLHPDNIGTDIMESYGETSIDTHLLSSPHSYDSTPVTTFSLSPSFGPFGSVTKPAVSLFSTQNELPTMEAAPSSVFDPPSTPPIAITTSSDPEEHAMMILASKPHDRKVREEMANRLILFNQTTRKWECTLAGCNSVFSNDRKSYARSHVLVHHYGLLYECYWSVHDSSSHCNHTITDMHFQRRAAQVGDRFAGTREA